MDLKVVTFILLVPVKLDAVAGEAAGDKALNSLIGSLAGWKRSSSDSRLRHQRNPFCKRQFPTSAKVPRTLCKWVSERGNASATDHQV
jgi:hypothetical protein